MAFNVFWERPHVTSSQISASGRRRCCAAAVSQSAWAQAYPSRPVRFVVSFAAGGPLYEMVAKGDAEIGFNQISEVVTQPSVELIGPLPATIQNYRLFMADPG